MTATPTPPQLSCELCRDRKVKCDKLTPCTNCATTGAQCVPVYRQRRARGRHVAKQPAAAGSLLAPARVEKPGAGSLYPVAIAPQVSALDRDLSQRVRNIEAILERMSTERLNPTASLPPTTTSRSRGSSSKGSTPKQSNEAWSDLASEVSMKLSVPATFLPIC
jgi:hypothetical protein